MACLTGGWAALSPTTTPPLSTTNAAKHAGASASVQRSAARELRSCQADVRTKRTSVASEGPAGGSARVPTYVPTARRACALQRERQMRLLACYSQQALTDA